MRVGQNPAKGLETVAQPAEITAAVTTYIPFLSGYYQDSLEVLKLSLESLRAHADLPFDLMVFDNGSCEAVRDYLLEMQRQGKIQYLILSEENIGVVGAWNVIFGAAPGRTIAYSDYDIYFYPNWLSSLTAVLEAFPQAGMVTGLPLLTPLEFSTSTVQWAEETAGVVLQTGQAISVEDVWRHAQSIGTSRSETETFYKNNPGRSLEYQGKRVYIGAGHFQFVGRKAHFQELIPLQAERPMGGEVRNLDIAVNAAGYLRLCTPDWHVEHMGNTLQDKFKISAGVEAQQIKSSAMVKPGGHPFVRIKFVRRLLESLYGRIFRLLNE